MEEIKTNYTNELREDGSRLVTLANIKQRGISSLYAAMCFSRIFELKTTLVTRLFKRVSFKKSILLIVCKNTYKLIFPFQFRYKRSFAKKLGCYIYLRVCIFSITLLVLPQLNSSGNAEQVIECGSSRKSIPVPILIPNLIEEDEDKMDEIARSKEFTVEMKQELNLSFNNSIKTRKSVWRKLYLLLVNIEKTEDYSGVDLSEEFIEICFLFIPSIVYVNGII
uniref:Uncharacterized protein n=1 Tax=Onchocerca volvulus TaxID=6282 RepID=A0A8R1TLR3_ONCVO